MCRWTGTAQDRYCWNMVKHVSRPEFVVTRFHGMLTVSPQMRAMFELVRRVARTDAAVLVRGETGTGKELVAGAIHVLSPRAEGPFRALNCALLTRELLASEMFGHVRGAFTGPVRDRPGLFRLADQGTLFLDEVAEIPLDLQARLLRAVQEQRFVPVGGTDPIRVDVRVLSATHRALRREVAQHRFRADLMYRLRVVPLFVPRLADREGDVEALTWHFIDVFNAMGHRRVTSLDARALDALLSYDWPGNVRELRNVVEHAFALGEGPVLSVDELTPELRGEPPPGGWDREPTLAELERTRIVEALSACGGRRQEAAAALGMSRTTLWRKIRELGL